MTKAQTKAGKRAKAKMRAACAISGVSLSAEADAQPMRETVAEALDLALRRRCAVMGWAPTPENIRRARDHRMGSLYGRLMLAGRLRRMGASDQTQDDAYRGIEELDRLSRQYRRIVLGVDIPGDATGPIDPEADPRDLANRWVMADAVLARAGTRPAVEYVITAGPDTPPSIVPDAMAWLAAWGGLALARHFGFRE